MHVVLRVSVVIMVGWICGFLWFVNQIPHDSAVPHEDAETIIILTGGAMRVQEGMAVFAATQCKKVLVSGIGVGVTTDDIIRSISENEALFTAEEDFDLQGAAEMQSRNTDGEYKMLPLVLGRIATSTVTNAYESKIFMDLNHFHSAKIVTSNYHIPRTKLVFEHVMPDNRFVYHPVYSWHLYGIDGMPKLDSLKIAAREYHKYLMTWMVMQYEKFLYVWDIAVYWVYGLTVF